MKKLNLTTEKFLVHLIKFREQNEKLKKETFERISNDPLYSFEWDAEAFYKAVLMLQYLNEIENAMTATETNMVPRSIAQVHEFYLGILLSSTSMMDRSSNMMHNFTSMWRKETIAVLLKWFQE